MCHTFVHSCIGGVTIAHTASRRRLLAHHDVGALICGVRAGCGTIVATGIEIGTVARMIVNAIEIATGVIVHGIGTGVGIWRVSCHAFVHSCIGDVTVARTHVHTRPRANQGRSTSSCPNEMLHSVGWNESSSSGQNAGTCCLTCQGLHQSVHVQR